jgi:hypothetical protein
MRACLRGRLNLQPGSCHETSALAQTVRVGAVDVISLRMWEAVSVYDGEVLNYL